VKSTWGIKWIALVRIKGCTAARAQINRSKNDEQYIFNTVNSGQTPFSGQAQVAQKS